MAIKNVPIYNQSVRKFQGFSTDVKPTNCGDGSVFIELDKDTKQVSDIYLFHEGIWYKY